MRYFYTIVRARIGPEEDTLEQLIDRMAQKGYRVHTIDFSERAVLMERYQTTETK